MDWWIWMLIGLALLTLEILIPGGIIMVFFGVAALLVGLLVALGIGGPLWFQILVFTVLSVVSLLTLRGPILRRMKATPGSEDPIDSLIGSQALVLEAMAPGDEGKVELRGTAWSALNEGEATLEPGAKCRVSRVESLKLYVR
jgi:membrane protein implicated in regulation of membrane protease activity